MEIRASSRLRCRLACSTLDRVSQSHTACAYARIALFPEADRIPLVRGRRPLPFAESIQAVRRRNEGHFLSLNAKSLYSLAMSVKVRHYLGRGVPARHGCIRGARARPRTEFEADATAARRPAKAATRIAAPGAPPTVARAPRPDRVPLHREPKLGEQDARRRRVCRPPRRAGLHISAEGFTSPPLHSSLSRVHLSIAPRGQAA